MPPIRVLIVNDVKETRENIKLMLANESDFAVIGEASNGVEAVREFEKLLPDVVCMDTNMPYLDGLKASQVISYRWQGARIIMLAIQCSDNDFAEQARLVGVEKCLEIPPTTSELISTIRELSRDACLKRREESELENDESYNQLYFEFLETQEKLDAHLSKRIPNTSLLESVSSFHGFDVPLDQALVHFEKLCHERGKSQGNSTRYYITARRGNQASYLYGKFSSSYRDWPLPVDHAPAPWLNAGENPYSFLLIRTLSELIEHGLDQEIYRVEYRGHSLDIPDRLSPVGWGKYVVRGLPVRESRILYKVNSWCYFIALTFACDCVERTLFYLKEEENLQDHHHQALDIYYKAVDIGRRLCSAAFELMKSEEYSKLILEYALYPGVLASIALPDFPSHQAIDEYRNEILQIAESEVWSTRFAGKAAAACVDRMYYRAAYEAALNARITRAIIRVHPVHYFDKNEEEKSQIDNQFNEEQLSELQWQSDRLAYLLGEK